ncbi:thiamine phosphate synthase [Mucilaginibacter paludis]|uniref:Thiamine-phosphate synthase n=1 Tax=Mucilaginibacter paludis DSM 18603 TaxID=714943 RepID=H1Y610_9SPHI|nr:thiamine phosphate synthase [Mucilaginibacter paludis]EHQ30969.1 Thiamine-phosphate pyrophosphorylase [Mucilaginibacter paludis DSM 18603]
MIDQLHYISQQPENGSHLTAIQQALEAGCRWIQLRVKNQPQDVILKYAFIAKRMCNLHGAKLIVDDHPEIALAVGAHGVHLGLQDMPVSQARRMVGDQMIIGGTANTFQHIRQRADEGVDYIGCGPYRFTTTKQKLSPIVGLSGYEILAGQMDAAGIHIPVIAIGGILPEDVPLIRQTGLYGVAISGAITFSGNREQTVAQIYRQLKTPCLKRVI